MIPLPNPNLQFAEQPVLILLAQAVIGEAESATEAQKQGVGSVVRNRVNDYKGRYGHDWTSVILHSGSFSSFNRNSDRIATMLNPVKHSTLKVWEACYTVAYCVLNGNLPDNTDFATHYYTPPLHNFPSGWGNPEAYRFCLDIGDFHFYREL
jgi:spore germination cell wall hydrolase CwlJ-like protein